MIPWIMALAGLVIGFTAGKMFLPGMVGPLSATLVEGHAFSALIATLMVWGLAMGILV